MTDGLKEIALVFFGGFLAGRLVAAIAERISNYKHNQPPHGET